jgi:hypothetical protein
MVAVLLAAGAYARKVDRPKPVTDSARRPVGQVSPAPAALLTSIFAEFTFDDGVGGPDPQGWTTVDVSAAPDTFFHVDDFFGLVGDRLGPLEGGQSLWCGTGLAQGQCHYAAPPGYGHSWNQTFESMTFPVSGDVTLSFITRYDSEAGFDRTDVQYRLDAGGWATIMSLEGRGDSLVTVAVPPGSTPGTVKLRFHFLSDGSWDDEDGLWDTQGAIIIDDLTVTDTVGVVDFQNFESETPGDLITSDGRWKAGTGPSYGDFGALFDGTTVLQEDSLITNTTYLWGFFSGSTYDYSCGGYPGQLVVPYGNSAGDYIFNEIWSPMIDLSQDKDGLPVFLGDRNLTLACDVYRDLNLNAVVFYQYRVRYLVDGCESPWQTGPFLHYGDPKDWYRQTWEFTAMAGATHVQVALGVKDACVTWCGVAGDGSCHSHSPLFDNVTLSRSYDAIVVTNTNDTGRGSLRAALTSANAAPDTNVVSFNIPGAGPHIITPTSGLPTLTSPVIIDGFTQPGSSPNTNGPGQPGNAVMKIVIDGSATPPPPLGFSCIGLSGGNSTVRGVVINNYGRHGVQINSSGNAVEGCYIGVDVDAKFDEGNGFSGVYINTGENNNRIGGSAASQRNIISGNSSSGVHIAGGSSNVVEGNFIGTGRTGTTEIPNSQYGVYLGNPTASTVGGETPQERNVISGNTRDGILIFQGSNVEIANNFIGTDVSGTLPLGNGENGVEIFSTSAGTTIRVQKANTIAFNSEDGVRVGDGHQGLYRVVGNNIHSNTGLGIDVGPDGVTPNSPTDGLLDTPTLSSVVVDPGGTRFEGTVTGAPSEVLTLQFYSNTACDPSGSGEGETYLNGGDVTTDVSGNATFSFWRPILAPVGSYVTANATAGFDSSSEFSICVVAINTPTGPGVVVEPVDSASTTTATYTGTIEICIQYDEAYVPGDEMDLELLHWATTPPPAHWDTITTSVDTLLNIICGETSTLSPFILVKPNPAVGVTADPGVPSAYALHQNVPNPFNPTTTIAYDVPPGGGVVTLRVYDVAGRLVRTLVDTHQMAGRKFATWDGRNNSGLTVATGVYFYRMQAGNFVQTRKMLLLK